MTIGRTYFVFLCYICRLMKLSLSKILLLLILLSMGTEMVVVAITTATETSVLVATDELDKSEKEEVAKDKILSQGYLNFFAEKNAPVSYFIITYSSNEYKKLPEIPPKQA